MIELTVDALDPGISRFQLYLAAFITLIAIIFTVVKALLAERDAERRKKVFSEMKEYKEKVRREEVRKHQDALKKWEDGEDWPVGGKEDEVEPVKEKSKAAPEKKDKGGGPDAKKEK
jgi:flagellar biosynthesis/type III secretory pathway M-ring protein FliF/YscJ